MKMGKAFQGGAIKRHTILGAGGAIGVSLANELLAHNQKVKLMSRSGFSMPGATSVKGDLTSLGDTLRAVEGSDVVYLCAGLPYRYEIWKERWPRIMNHVIEACYKEDSLLIFFDNVYMYGRVEGKMTEQTPYNPCSKKGEIRATIARQLESEMSKVSMRAIIGRASDLYGPYSVQSSLLYLLMIKNLRKGKKAQWMGSLTQPHSFTYTLDCAKALRQLADDPRACNQVWHLPTFSPGPTGEEWVQLLSSQINVDPRTMLVPKWVLKTMGYFDITLTEVYELVFQQEMDYHFDSTKFNTFFNFEPTSYEKGIRETIAYLDQIKQ
ncbi:NAD-dependent epimerase/dehydratase family protein [Mangrovibacterium sp.]|uniref:NAD-dependent epimerase/dehydratase family protein n=1 Tax=Mangrovibacterium sp. TaxID=1961364 RepID=UPI0035638505